MTTRELANQLGVTPQAVNKAIREGRLSPEAKNDPKLAAKEWKRKSKPRADVPFHAAGEGSPDEFRKASTEQRIQLAEWTKIKVAEKKGSLVPKAEVKRAHSAVVTPLRDHILTFPDDRAIAIAAELGISDHVSFHRVLKRHLHAFMADIRKTLLEEIAI